MVGVQPTSSVRLMGPPRSAHQLHAGHRRRGQHSMRVPGLVRVQARRPAQQAQARRPRQPRRPAQQAQARRPRQPAQSVPCHPERLFRLPVRPKMFHMFQCQCIWHSHVCLRCHRSGRRNQCSGHDQVAAEVAFLVGTEAEPTPSAETPWTPSTSCRMSKSSGAEAEAVEEATATICSSGSQSAPARTFEQAVVGRRLQATHITHSRPVVIQARAVCWACL